MDSLDLAFERILWCKLCKGSSSQSLKGNRQQCSPTYSVAIYINIHAIEINEMIEINEIMIKRRINKTVKDFAHCIVHVIHMCLFFLNSLKLSLNWIF